MQTRESLAGDPDQPLVQRIMADLRHRIRSGELAVGSKLPSIRELHRRLDCSISVVRQALTTLTAEGLIEARPRSGLYVADPRARARARSPESGVSRSDSLPHLTQQTHEGHRRWLAPKRRRTRLSQWCTARAFPVTSLQTRV